MRRRLPAMRMGCVEQDRGEFLFHRQTTEEQNGNGIGSVYSEVAVLSNFTDVDINPGPSQSYSREWKRVGLNRRAPQAKSHCGNRQRIGAAVTADCVGLP